MTKVIHLQNYDLRIKEIELNKKEVDEIETINVIRKWIFKFEHNLIE